MQIQLLDYTRVAKLQLVLLAPQFLTSSATDRPTQSSIPYTVSKLWGRRLY